MLKLPWNQRIVEYGDHVVMYASPLDVTFIIVTKGKIFQNRYGIFPHDSLVGLRYGIKICGVKQQGNNNKNNNRNGGSGGGGGGFMHILAMTPELWSRTLPHRTQVIFASDSALICYHLHLKPGCIVYESGTGSGSLSMALIKTISPTGHVHTFEYDRPRADAARVSFKELGLDSMVTVYHGNVCGEHGFKGCTSPENKQQTLEEEKNDIVVAPTVMADAIFLDLPHPWLAIPHASKVLNQGGRLCSFSPCIEQVQKSCIELSRCGFVKIKTVECIQRELVSKNVSMIASEEGIKLIEETINNNKSLNLSKINISTTTTSTTTTSMIVNKTKPDNNNNNKNKRVFSDLVVEEEEKEEGQGEKKQSNQFEEQEIIHEVQEQQLQEEEVEEEEENDEEPKNEKRNKNKMDINANLLPTIRYKRIRKYLVEGESLENVSSVTNGYSRMAGHTGYLTFAEFPGI